MSADVIRMSDHRPPAKVQVPPERTPLAVAAWNAYGAGVALWLAWLDAWRPRR